MLQVTNEIVRQLLEQNGFYSTEKPIGDMKFIVDCNYIGAMNTPGGGKNDIPNRLKRQFNLYYVPLPSKASINNVYGALVEGRFTPDLFDADTIDLSKRLVPMTIALWNKVQVCVAPSTLAYSRLTWSSLSFCSYTSSTVEKPILLLVCRVKCCQLQQSSTISSTCVSYQRSSKELFLQPVIGSRKLPLVIAMVVMSQAQLDIFLPCGFTSVDVSSVIS